MARSLGATLKPLLNLLAGRPVAAVFEVCLRCNSACGYCDLPLNAGRYEMTRDEIRSVFTRLHGDGLRHVFVQGGEPLVRRDLPEVLDDLAEIGFSLSLVTNGTRLTKRIAARLARNRLGIAVSLDTLDRNSYRRIRGADHLPRVLAGIASLADYPHPKYLTCIVTESNRKHALEVARFARARGFIPVLGAYHWDVGRYGKADPLLQYRQDGAVEAFQEILASELVPRGYFRNYLRDNIHWLQGKRLPRCDAGRYSIVIDASGNVAPCLAQPQAGNLLESGLDEILAKVDRTAVKRCSDGSSCNLLCGRVVGATLRNPVAALLTPSVVAPLGEPESAGPPP